MLPRVETLLPRAVGLKLRRQHLDGHVAVERQVKRAIHLAHPAEINRRNDSVRAESSPRIQGTLFGPWLRLEITRPTRSGVFRVDRGVCPKHGRVLQNRVLRICVQ